MTRRETATALAGLAVLTAAGQTALSGAVFTSDSVNPGTAVTANGDWTAPMATMADPGSPLKGTVTLTATATDARSGVASVRIQRATAGSGQWVDVCTDATAPYTCAFDTVAAGEGRYDLRAVALDKAGIQGTSNVVASRLVDNTGPTVAVTDPASALRGIATITMSASDDGAGVKSVRLQRAPAGTTTWTDVCTDTTAPYSCSITTTSLADGAYDLRAIATDNLDQTTTSALVEDVEIDNTAPAITMGNPGTPLSGTVTLTATGDDGDGSGVVSVRIQRAAAGSGQWVDVCTVTAEPFSCRWSTPSVADGFYDLRAIATDGAGNTRTSTTVTNRQVVNTAVNTVSLEDPGAVLRGGVTLEAQANATLGVTSVRIERRRVGTTTWTAVCTDATAPYTCAWDTTTVTDGSYELRAVLTPAVGLPVTSTVLTRIVDNAPVRGLDVQAINATTVGRIVTGDQLQLTYTRPMAPATLITGWDGAAPATTTVRLVDAAGLDRLELGGNLGAVALNANRIRKNKTMTFSATVALSAAPNGGSIVTLTVGNVLSGTGRQTGSVAATMSWTPSAAAKDATGVAVSAAPVAELGALDLDF